MLRVSSFVIAGVVLVLSACGVCQAGVIFSDDFSGSSIDLSKWSLDKSSGCSVTIQSGKLESLFSAGHAYAISKVLELPTGWTSVALEGKWSYGTGGDTGEMPISVFKAGDTSQYVHVSYAQWYDAGGSSTDNFRASDSGSMPSYVLLRAIPTAPALVPFALTITPTGWTFVDQGTTLVNETTSHMAGLSQIQFRIGGWDASSGYEQVLFDDIQVTFIPEPATLMLLGVGLVGLVLRRKRR